MTEMKFKEWTTIIEAELIKEYGIGFLSLSRNERCAMITHKFIDLLQSCKERQD